MLQNKPSFTYFRAKVFGQFPRFLLNYLGVDYEDIYIGPIQDDFRNTLKFGQVPLFVDSDGFRLTQTFAIVKYIAAKYADPDFLGKTIKDKAIVDEHVSAILTDMIVPGYKVRSGAEDPKVMETLIPRYFGAFEKSLTSSTGKYICGDYITLADLCVFAVYHYYHHLGHTEVLSGKYIRLDELKSFFESIPSIQNYIATRPDNGRGT